MRLKSSFESAIKKRTANPSVDGALRFVDHEEGRVAVSAQVSLGRNQHSVFDEKGQRRSLEL